ncbi:hypothetical protein DPMN_012656 [Dreissena polymorpha]|uniref:Uncharacterized protein n=1 Tax=Dreissena polymorpha TaxID=45954 RepID=A0A9D4S3J9_DREPO|nr:hypothetical protein DPMN_012656 [Dreissena polymorpha]
MSQNLHYVSKECSGFGWKKNVKNCTKALLNAREISAQEAKEEELFSSPAYEQYFQEDKTTRDANRGSLEHRTDIIEAAIQDFEKKRLSRHAFNEIFPAVE